MYILEHIHMHICIFTEISCAIFEAHGVWGLFEVIHCHKAMGRLRPIGFGAGQEVIAEGAQFLEARGAGLQEL